MALSLRGVSTALAAFGVSLSHMSVWRDNQEQSELLEKQHRWQGVRVLGLDGAYPLGWGKKRPVLIAVDLGNGVPVSIGQVDESNPQAVRRFLAPLVQRLGVSVVVTDSGDKLKRVLMDYPKLRVCVPHLGFDEITEYRNLIEKYDTLWLDTTMVLTDYFPIKEIVELKGYRLERILYGSDFPNIPYEWDRDLKWLSESDYPMTILNAY